MSTDQKPRKGQWATARKVVHGDFRDETRGDGVVVGEPRPGNGGYYDILNPYTGQPFRGHTDDARTVPDEQLSRSERQFKEQVNRQLQQDSKP